MQPILAESAPHRGRAVAFAAALAVVAALLIPTVGPHRYRDHHRMRSMCPHSGHVVFIVR